MPLFVHYVIYVHNFYISFVREWSSPAFMKYLDFAQLEADACLKAHFDESDVEEVEGPSARRRRIVLIEAAFSNIMLVMNFVYLLVCFVFR